MSELKTATKRNDINILYTIGTILAVFGHSRPNAGFGYEGSVLNQIIIFIYTFHMPLFFIIAGILLYNSKSLEQKSYGVFIKDKALKLLTPYVILTAVFLIPKGYVEFGSLEFLNFEFVLKAFLSPRNNTWGHFWFLPVLFVCYIIAAGFKKLMLKLDEKYAPIFLMTFMVLSGLLMARPINTNWLGLKDISQNLFYMQFGMILALCEQHLKVNLNKALKIIIAVILVAVSVVAFIYNYAVLKGLIAMCMLLSLILMAKAFGNFFETGFSFISKNIFTIYIYSWIFQSFALILLTKLNVNLLVLNITMFVIGVLAPLLIAFIYKKLKKLNCKFFDLCLGVR